MKNKSVLNITILIISIVVLCIAAFAAFQIWIGPIIGIPDNSEGFGIIIVVLFGLVGIISLKLSIAKHEKIAAIILILLILIVVYNQIRIRTIKESSPAKEKYSQQEQPKPVAPNVI